MSTSDEPAGGLVSKSAGATTGAVAGVTLGGPFGLIAGSAGGALAEYVVDQILRRRRDRANVVIFEAGKAAEIAVDQLLQRLATTDQGERLLTRVLLAASNTQRDEKLVALAQLLGRAALTNNEIEHTKITVMADASDQVDAVGLQLLEAFRSTPNELGLGAGDPEFDEVVEHLNTTQYETVFPNLRDVHLPALAILQRLALIDARYNNSVSWGSNAESPADYTITDFGREFLNELDNARRHLAGGES